MNIYYSFFYNEFSYSLFYGESNIKNSNSSVRYNSETDMIEICFNGIWKEWKKANLTALYLYDGGSLVDFNAVFENYRGNVSAKEYSSYVTLTFPTYNVAHTFKGTIDTVNIPDNATRLKIKYTTLGDSGILGIASSKITGTSYFQISKCLTATSTITTVEIDVSAYAGMNYYVVLAGSTNLSVNLYALWFE